MGENRTDSTAAVPSMFRYALAYPGVSARKKFESENSSRSRCQSRRAALRRYGRKMTRNDVRQSRRTLSKRCGREARRSGDIIRFRFGVAGAKSRLFGAKPATRSAQRRKAGSLRGGRPGSDFDSGSLIFLGLQYAHRPRSDGNSRIFALVFRQMFHESLDVLLHLRVLIELG